MPWAIVGYGLLSGLGALCVIGYVLWFGHYFVTAIGMALAGWVRRVRLPDSQEQDRACQACKGDKP